MIRRRDDGRVSVFLAVALFAVLVVIGLSFDAAGRFRAVQRANNLAAEAARAGGQQIDLDAAMGAGRRVVDPQRAAEAAEAYLARANVDGTAQWVTSVQGCPGDAQCLEVTVEMPYQMVMLPLFGFPGEIEVTGTATAQLLTDEDI